LGPAAEGHDHKCDSGKIPETQYGLHGLHGSLPSALTGKECPRTSAKDVIASTKRRIVVAESWPHRSSIQLDEYRAEQQQRSGAQKAARSESAEQAKGSLSAAAVVPAQAATHTPPQRNMTWPASNRESGGYGSPLARG
jgi:hypothetical protein